MLINRPRRAGGLANCNILLVKASVPTMVAPSRTNIAKAHRNEWTVARRIKPNENAAGLFHLGLRHCNFQQRDDERQKAQRVEVEATGGAERPEREACERWADRARHVELR